MRSGLLPEGSGGNELLTALQDRKTQYFQHEVDPSVIGNVTQEMAEKLPLKKAGPIILTEDGIQHIEEQHGGQIKGLGYADAREFVAFVLSNVDAIYQGGSSRKFVLVTRQTTPNGHVLARLEFEESGDHYKIITAHPIQEGRYKKRTPLWERAHTTLFQEENPSATRRASQRGQSGERLNLNASVPEVKITDTPAFRNWFGASKVVDENGEPLVVYHGTNEQFDAFEEDKIGTRRDAGRLGRGFYFSDDSRVGEDSENLLDVYLSMQNPLTLQLPEFGYNKTILMAEALGIEWKGRVMDREFAEELREVAVSSGYDGVILDYSNTGYKGKEFVAFSPTQIKSVNNRGTFDPKDPRILFQSASHASPYRFDRFSLEHLKLAHKKAK